MIVGTTHQWFVLRSEDGFIFKHCREKSYITAPWSVGRGGSQPARATQYPTPWAIHTKKGSDDLKCVITVALDQCEYLAGRECVGLVGEVSRREVCVAQLSETEEQGQLWRLERIGDTTIEEDWEQRARELVRELEVLNARCTSDQSKLETMLQRLDTREAKLENIRNELSEQAAELETVRIELSRQATELKGHYRALDEIREVLDAKEQAMSDRDRSVQDEEVDEQNQEVDEQNQEVFQEDSPHGSQVAEETVLDEQVPQSAVEHPQNEETNNMAVSTPAIPVPVPEPALNPENKIRDVHPPPPAAVDQRLAQLGWAFD
ncbi:unnamed protein product [Rhizoctonia solani]|uniref:Uncharacterized protein n=1 Tax=Rhizoctonia solani TaxID=456999 RepID=A0A8H2WPQ3_9AGAM|nr:unnamed protein product [Rhizoctonia solani]